MKNISKLFFAAITLIGFFSACSKVDNLRKSDPLPVYQAGVSPVLSSSASTVAPALADSAKAIVSFSWTNPKYSNDSATTKYILEIDSTGKNFAKENTKTVSGALTTPLTGRELNGILLNLGFKLGVAQSIDVRLISSYGNNNERYMSNVVKVTVTPFADPSVLTSANSSVTCALNTAASLSNTFNWGVSFKGYAGIVTYTLQYDSSGKNFATANEIAAGPSVLTKALNQGEMNETALTEGVAGGTTGKIEYRIKAVSALGAVAYSNTVSVTIETYIPILRFYLPGGYQTATGNGTNWTPGNAPELIRDTRPGALNKLYYIYIWLPGGSEFKVTQGRGWDINYGGAGGTLSSGGANLTVATSGFYRVSIDRTSLKYDIREGRMGFVGGATGAGWNPPNVFPTYAMGNSATNLFVGITDFTVNGWKLIDYNNWNNGDLTVTNARSYGSTGGSGSNLEVNGANMPDITTAGRYRVIWDGRGIDNVKYEMSPATEMRVVGDGMQGIAAWNPGASPQMTYLGAGKWELTLALVAGRDIKFLAGNDWGAFDYEDNSGGSTATGVARKIKWEGGSNFKTPAADGTYTITLDENAQTVTIN